MLKQRLSFLLALACCVSSRCAAQWTLGAYFGAAHTQNSSLALRQPALGTNISFQNIAYEGESFQPPLYYGLRGGYWFQHHWGLETEFTHLKVFAKVADPVTVTGVLNGAPINARVVLGSIVQRFSISHGVNLLLANAVFHHALWKSDQERNLRADAALRFGAGATIPHVESTIQSFAQEHYQLGSPAIQLSGSIELRIWGRVYWMGEYKFTRTREHLDVNSGAATTLLESHHLVTGPAFHF